MSQWVNSVIKEVVVYRSLSHNVYTNLALEEWMMRNVDHQGKRTLLLWRNSPCVVIGRFQNPWMECDMNRLESIPAAMARRKSGGGAVYHDMGNLNCSFFAHRADYNRTRNLQLVCQAVNRHWEGVDLRVGERNDIWCHGRKVSGSAARIAKDHTYHHFTLLIDSNMDDLHSVLKPCPKMSFQSTTSATRSMPSPTTNIKTINSCIEYDEVCHVVAREFYDIHGINHNQLQINDVHPTSFDGVMDIMEELNSHEWIWGNTPKFNVEIEQVRLEVTAGIITSISDNNFSLKGKTFTQYMKEKKL